MRNIPLTIPEDQFQTLLRAVMALPWSEANPLMSNLVMQQNMAQQLANRQEREAAYLSVKAEREQAEAMAACEAAAQAAQAAQEPVQKRPARRRRVS